MLKILFRIGFLISIAWIPFLLANQNEVGAECSSKICPELNALLEKGEKVNVLVSFKKGVKSSLEKITTLPRTGDRGVRNKAIKDALAENADTSQGGVVQLLSARQGGGEGFKYFKSFWISNSLFIREASAEVVRKVAEDPEVVKIIQEPIMAFPSDNDIQVVKENGEKMTYQKNERENWGVPYMQAPEAWAELGGKKGEGVIIGSIDSGVRHTHEILRDNFMGINYGWYDALNKSGMPRWTTDHGTGVLGLAVGNNNFGVAPGARWMTCLACDMGICKGAALLDCMQWMSCPTLPDGTNEDCSKAPHIINNSWASERNVDDFNEAIKVWLAKGIIPVWGIGSVGVPFCQKTMSPGEKNFVIGVGMHNYKGWHDIGSPIGPAPDGTIKPDLLAPGTAVWSSDPFEDDSYGSFVGTSFASPHVAGLVALLKVREPEISFEKVFQILTQSALKNVTVNLIYHDEYCKPENNCGNVTCRNDTYPNIIFGHGSAHALNAVRLQTTLLEGNKK